MGRRIQMKCDKCHKEQPSGSTYMFYYGKKGGTTTQYDFSQMQKTTSTAYQIAGQNSAQICDKCVLRSQVFYLLYTGVLPVGFLLTAYDAFSSGNTANVVVCGGIGIILLFVIPIITFRGKQEFGEKAAISVWKKELKSQNYNAFLTTARYKKMGQK
jgi:hypothetical protein